ncbi:MAG: recombinase family protein [Roseburia sp.]
MLTNYLIYLRKSRADNPDMTVDEVLAKHETILQDFARSEFGEEIPERFIFREVVSGETIAARPIMQRLMQLLESSNVKGVLVVDPQRLSRGDLEDCGKIVNVFRYTGTQVLTPQRSYNLADEYDRKFFELELTRGNDYLEYTKRSFTADAPPQSNEGIISALWLHMAIKK